MRDKDCFCHNCKKEIHHLGIMSHRAMHRRKQESVTITYSTGKTFIHSYEVKKA